MKNLKFFSKSKSFVPNRSFWFLLVVLLIGIWIRIEPKIDNINQFSLNIAFLFLLGLFLRKINNTMLLGQSKFVALVKRPVQLQFGNMQFVYYPNKTFWCLIGSICLIGYSLSYYLYPNQNLESEMILIQERNNEMEIDFEDKSFKNDLMNQFSTYFQSFNVNNDYKDSFIIQKQLLTSQYLIKERVTRIDQLSDSSLLSISHDIATIFENLILDKMELHPHVNVFFKDTIDIDKIEISLIEQAKYHIPASITLAQSALETAWGRRIIQNNYFGIKDKTNSTKYTTTEYYNKKELDQNKHLILSNRKVGKNQYKCTVKDFFVAYETPWDSFRDHSILLSKSKKYAPLFTKGKNYKEWANMIGSTKNGGVGYATSPVYGNLLKKIIKKYNLDLLDY